MPDPAFPAYNAMCRYLDEHEKLRADLLRKLERFEARLSLAKSIVFPMGMKQRQSKSIVAIPPCEIPARQS